MESALKAMHQGSCKLLKQQLKVARNEGLQLTAVHHYLYSLAMVTCRKALCWGMLLSAARRSFFSGHICLEWHMA